MIPTPNQPERRPILGFVAGSLILTADGPQFSRHSASK
jgi:hypothetical protein